MSLRPYQRECLDAVRVARIEGCVRQLVVLPTACHAKGQPILMYDGSVKLVEDIVIGDRLMGPDSTPRTVMELHHGIGEMARIRPKRGYWFDVTMVHVLTLVRTNDEPGRDGEITDISVRDYLAESKTFRHIHKLFHVGVEFPAHGIPLPIDHYLLGLILGDGS